MVTTGTRIGPYEIVSTLGAGGMGEVYRARDTKLGREVALKILPEAFATDPDRLARFEREAKTLAVLNHPHIAQIHGLEDAPAAGAPSARALVMELVEGPTLADRIAEGPLPLDEAVSVARQISEALEAAHDAGIIHRDLKPANIKLRSDGVVKVLDFGLAKAVEGRAASDLAHSPTLSVAATQAGIILGTAAYMSPEQVRGRRVDERVDIWAFGCVLFEMLSGRPPFRGDSVNDLMAAVIAEEPDWSALPPSLPPGVVAVIKRCLRKDPRQRTRNITDARLDLDDALAQPSPIVRPATVARGRVWLPWAIAAVLLVAVSLLAWRVSRVTPVRLDPVRFSVLPPSGLDLSQPNWPLVTVSPDGTRIAIPYDVGGLTKLFIRRLNEFTATELPGTDRGSSPFFSPDGNWIGFSADRKLKKVSVDGRSSVILCDADWGGGTWGPDDAIVFTPQYDAGLWRVAAGGGTPQKLTDKAASELGHWWPQFLPDGKSVLFTVFASPIERSHIDVYSLETGKRTMVIEGALFGRYTATGHLLFMRGESVMAVRFDPGTLQTTGQPTPVIDNVATTSTNGFAHFSVSSAGTLAYVPAEGLKVGHRLVWMDRKGTAQPATSTVQRYFMPRLSPDGRRLALTIEQNADHDVWVYEFSRGTFTRATAEAAYQFSPVWTVDGRALVFAFEQPQYQIYRRTADMTRPAERLLAGEQDAVPQSVTPDGKFVIYERDATTTARDLWRLPLDGGAPTPLVASPAADMQGTVSPNGRWLAYVSDESGRTEVYLQAYPQNTGRVQISSNGANWPVWSRDGKELFFVEAGRKLMAVSIGNGQELVASQPVMLFQSRFDFGYDVGPDGRFIVSQWDPNAPPVPVNVVLNWFNELNAKVP